MVKKEISDRIKSLLVEDLFLADSVDQISGSAQLGPDLGMDSVGFVELATLVSELFEIKVTDTDLADGHFSCVDKLTEFVAMRLQQKSADKEKASS